MNLPTLARAAALAALLSASTACSNLFPMAGDGGPVPLDGTRAIALARQKVCGDPGSPGDLACTVRGHERVRGVHYVVIERGPPAAGPTGDRVRVALRDHGMRVDVEPWPEG